MKKIAVLGYGVVGSGVVELFYRNQKKIEKNTGTELEIDRKSVVWERV